MAKPKHDAPTPQEPSNAATDTPAAKEKHSAPRQRNVVAQVSLFLSILTLIVLVVLFYALSRNDQGMVKKIAQLEKLETQTTFFSGQLELFSKKMQSIEAEVKTQSRDTAVLHAALRNTLLDQAARQLAYVASHLDQQAEKNDLKQAISLIQKAKREPTPAAIKAPEPTQK